MAIEFINKKIDEVEIDGLNLTEIYIDGERVHYQPYLFEKWEGYEYYDLTGVKGDVTLSEEITLPKTYNDASIVTIDSSAFEGRTDIKSVTIPGGYLKISSDAFKGSSIESVTIDSTVTSIYSGAFENTALKSVYVQSKNLSYWTKGLFLYGAANSGSNPLNGGEATLYIDGKEVTEVTLPEGSLGCYVFYNYKKLKSITMPEGMKTIGAYALYGTGIEEVTIPSTASFSDYYHFANSSLRTVTFAPGSGVTEIPRGCFSDTPLTSITLPEKLTGINYRAFYNCTKLPLIDIPEGVARINSQAFKGCAALKNVVLPETLTKIESGAFAETAIETVFYKGGKADWKKINIDSTDNGKLINAERLYYSQNKPGLLTDKTEYWHYDSDGAPAPWKGSCADGHTWINATCDKPKTCAVCGTTVGTSLGHDYVNHDKKVPTCTEDGWEAYTTCSRCDYSSGIVTISAKGHTEVIDAAVAPTCTKTGLTEGKHCSECGKVLLAQEEKPMLDHTWILGDDPDGWEITTYPTTTTPGEAQRKCSECGKIETLVIPAIESGHNHLAFSLNEDGKSYTVSAIANVWFTDVLYIPPELESPFSASVKYPVTRIGKIGGTKVNPTKLSLSTNIKEIEEGAFEGCTNLRGVKLPESITKIGAGAFKGCTNMRYAMIEAVSLELGQEIFADCPSLRYIYYKGTAHDWGTIRGGAWREETDPIKIQTGAPHAVVCFCSLEQPSSLNVGQNTNYWYYNTQMPEYDSPALIWPRDDLYDFMVMRYELPLSAGTLFDYGLFIKAKVSSNPLTGVQVLPEMYEGQPIIGIAPSGFHPQGYEVIETKDETGKPIDVKQVWRENKLRKLTGVIIPDTYKYIGLGAFAFCSGMGSLFIPNSVKYIDEGAFLETTQYIPPGEATYELVYDDNFVEKHEVYTSDGETHVGSTSISWEENPETGEEGWKASGYGWLTPTDEEDEECQWWYSADEAYLIDVQNMTLVNVPSWKKTAGTYEYHGGRTSINFEHYGAGDYWDSAWHRGMSHGKVTRPGYFTKLRNQNTSECVTDMSQIHETGYYLDTVFMNTRGYYDSTTGENLGEGPAMPYSARLRKPIGEDFSTFNTPYYLKSLKDIYSAKLSEEELDKAIAEAIEKLWGCTGSEATILLEPNATPDDVVETPKVGETYKFGMAIPGDNKISTFFASNTFNGVILKADKYTAAVPVYLEDAEGGYYFYQKSSGSKTYINLNADADVEYGIEASTVYQYDTAKKTLVTQIGKIKYCFGVDKEFGLIKAYDVTSKDMYIMRLYRASSFYMGTKSRGDQVLKGTTPSEYFTLVPQQEGDSKLKLTENKNTLFKFEKAPSGEVAIVTDYEGQQYWLGILSDAQTNLRLIPGSPFRTYTEHGTISQWGCKPSGYYKINASEVSGTKELNASAEVLNIPDSLYGNDITTIADRAFSGAVATGASIGNNITSIGAHAFAGTKLQSIKIPLNVEVIKSGAFAGCKGIKIYCAAAGKPEGWADDWCDSDAEIEWAYCDDHRELTMVEESTCTTSGVTLHYCPNCDYAYMTDIKPAFGHDWEELEYVKPTCEAQGYKRRRCRTCGAISGTNYTDALGHKYRETIIKPTCYTAGWTEFTCTVCGDWYRDFYLPPFDHMPGEWETIKNPTNSTPGLRRQFCIHCGELVKEENIPALGCSAGHTYKATSTTPPTCDADGYTTYTCELCGDTYIGDFVPSLGHDTNGWEVVKEPTCVTEGLKRTVCQTCGLVEEQTMPPIPGAHTYQTHEDVESTCVEQGYTTMKCSNCGHEVTTYKKPVDHDWDTEVEVVQPTCSEQGYTIHTCNACGYTKTDSFTPATGLHKWGEWEIVIPPDCTVAGEQKCNCTDCGEAWAISIPKTDHTESDWIIDKEPTTEEEGLKHKECTFCGYKFPSITIPKLEETDNYILTESGDFLTDEEGNKLIIEGE